jgi:hypothetical protein
MKIPADSWKPEMKPDATRVGTRLIGCVRNFWREGLRLSIPQKAHAGSVLSEQSLLLFNIETLVLRARSEFNGFAGLKD